MRNWHAGKLPLAEIALNAHFPRSPALRERFIAQPA